VALNLWTKGTYEVFATATVKFADVIERETDFVIHDWMERAQKHEDLVHIPLTFDARTGHLPELVRDVQPDCDWMSEQRPPISITASPHGDFVSETGLYGGYAYRGVAAFRGISLYYST